MAKTETTEGSNVIRNMIISVLTTVLGATIIYFLGFNNKKPGFTKLEREDATVNAWKTYVTVENIYAKNSTSLIRDRILEKIELEDFLSESLKESETLRSSLNELIVAEGIDKDLVSTFKRRLANEELQFAKWNRIINRFKEMKNSEWFQKMTEKQQTDTVMVEDKKYADQSTGVVERAITDIEDLSKTLSERYDQPFSMDDFLIIQAYKYKKDIFTLIDSDSTSVVPPSDKKTGINDQPAAPVTVTRKYLTGKWNSNGSVMTLNADGKCSWFNPTNNMETKGVWQLKKDQLTLNVTDQKTGNKILWIFELSGITENAFTLKLSGDVSNPSYRMARM